MIIRRARQESSFTVVPNATLRDSRLSLEARGLLVWLISQPPGWEIMMGPLQRTHGIGRDRLRRILRDLEGAGYLVRRRRHGAGGKWIWESEIYGESQISGGEQGKNGSSVGAEPKSAASGANRGAKTIDWESVDGSSVDGEGVDIEKKDPEKKDPQNTLSLPLPRDFSIDAKMKKWAAAEAPAVNIQTETAMFIDWHEARGTRRADWSAEWRIWIRRAAAHHATPPPRQGGEKRGRRRPEQVNALSAEHSYGKQSRDEEDWTYIPDGFLDDEPPAAAHRDQNEG